MSTSSIPSLVVIGNDALLAARPATAVQLAHACCGAGYDFAVPVSWGDELIATRVLSESADHGDRPAIFCVCPLVRGRLLGVGRDLVPFLISCVAPPVATARYLRALYAERAIRLTYVGSCPSAADAVFDERYPPRAFLERLTAEGIELARQPEVFDAVLPPDRRRFLSRPGGLPDSDVLWNRGARESVELLGDDLRVELSELLLAKQRVLVDFAPRIGCVCSGAVDDVDPSFARSLVVDCEPPRASSAIVSAEVLVDLSAPLPREADEPSPPIVVSPPEAMPAHATAEPLFPIEPLVDETEPVAETTTPAERASIRSSKSNAPAAQPRGRRRTRVFVSHGHRAAAPAADDIEHAVAEPAPVPAESFVEPAPAAVASDVEPPQVEVLPRGTVESQSSAGPDDPEAILAAATEVDTESHEFASETTPEQAEVDVPEAAVPPDSATTGPAAAKPSAGAQDLRPAGHAVRIAKTVAPPPARGRTLLLILATIAIVLLALFLSGLVL